MTDQTTQFTYKQKNSTRPYFAGFGVFVFLMSIGIYISIQQYALNKKERNEQMRVEFDQKVQTFRQTIDLANTCIFSLALTIDEKGTPRNFDRVAARLLEQNNFIDVLELLPEGKIQYIHPLKGNEIALGYDILADSGRNKEAIRALETQNIYYAGPVELKQGGFSIIGRYPIFIDDQFWGFSSILISLKTLIEHTGLGQVNSDFAFQFSKKNPNTQLEENFLPNRYHSHLVYQTVFLEGNWQLSIYDLKPSAALSGVIPFIVIYILFVLVCSYFTFDQIKKPEKLNRLLAIRSRELIKSERKFLDLFEESPSMMLSVDLKTGLILNCNNTLLRTMGYEKSEVVNKPSIDFYHVDDLPKVQKVLPEYRKTGTLDNVELRVITKAGNVRHILLSSTSVKDRNGTFIYSRSIWHDITDQKIAADQVTYLQSKMNAAIRIGQVGIWDWDTINRKVYWSDKMYEIYDVDLGTEIKDDTVPKCLHPDDLQSYKSDVKKRIRTKDTSTFEYRIVWRNGEIRHLLVEMEMLTNETGKIIKFQGITRDITSLKRAEEAERQNERFLETLVSNLPGYSYRVKNDQDYTPEYISPGVTDITGYEVDEYLIYHTISCGQEIVDEDKDLIWDQVQKAVDHKQPYELRYRINTKQGEVKWVWERGQGVWSPTGELEALEGFVTDITSQKIAEEKLIEFKDSLEESEKMAQLGSWRLLFDDSQVIWSKQMYRIFELSISDSAPSQEEFLERVHPDDKATIQYNLQLMSEGKQPDVHVYRTNPDVMSLKYLSANIRIGYDEKGNPYGFVGTVLDVTERIESELRISESELKYRTLIDQASDAIITYRLDGTLVDCNQAFCTLTGYSKKEFQKLKLEDLAFASDLKEDPIDHDRIRGGKLVIKERRIRRKNAKSIDLELHSRMTDDGTVIVIGRDLTERKKALKEILDAQKEKETTLNRISDKVLSFDNEWRYTMINDAALHEHALGREGTLGKTVWEVHPELVGSEFQKVFLESARDKKPMEIQDYFPPLDATFLVKVYPADDGITLFYLDVTDQVKAEQEIKDLLYRNQLMIETMLDGFVLTDMTGAIVDVNESYSKMIGYSKSALLKMNMKQLIVKFSPKEVEERIQTLVEKKSMTFETIHVKKDKTLIDLEISISLMETDDQQFIAAFVRDISERKKSEVKIQEALESLEMAEEMAKLGSWRYDMDGSNYVWTKQMFRTFGMEPSDQTPSLEGYLEYIHPNDRANILKLRDLMTQGKSPKPVMFRTNPDLLPLKYIYPSYKQVKGKNGSTDYLMGTLLDITDRVTSEEQLKKSETRFRELAEMLPEALVETDNKLMVTYANLKAFETSGYTFSDFKKGINCLELLDELERPRAKEIYKRRLQGEEIGMVEYCGRRKNGDLYPVLLHLNPIYSQQEVVGFRGIIIDITERKMAEKSVQDSEQKLREVLNNLHSGVVVHTQDTSVVLCNPMACELLGLSYDQMMGKSAIDPYWKFLDEDNIPVPLDKYPVYQVLNTKLSFQNITLCAIHGEGAPPVWLLINGFPVLNKEGEIKEVIISFIDITEKKLADEELKKHQLHLEELIEIRTHDIEKEKRMAETLHKMSLKFSSIPDLPKLHTTLLAEFKHLIPYDKAVLQILDDDRMKTVSCQGFNDSKKVLGSNLKATIELKKINLDSQPIIKKAVRSQWLDEPAENNKVSRLTIPLILAKSIVGIITLEKDQKDFFTNDHVRVASAFASNASISIANANLIKGIQEAKTSAEKAFNQLQETQGQLLQSEKMASLGLLTAGIAHELNNPINAINISVIGMERELNDVFGLLKEYSNFHTLPVNQTQWKKISKLREEIEPEFVQGLISETIEDLKSGSEKIVEIVSGLRKFSRLESDLKIKANVHEGIEDTLTLLKSLLQHKVKIVKKFDSRIKDIHCYPGQLNQVFMNLIVNAEQAIDGKGTITITTHALKKHIKIIFSDTGKGMDVKTIKKVFDPFFTTKEVGKGTGLGLSISYGIIEKHQGTIEVKSQIGKGTEFAIILPR